MGRAIHGVVDEHDHEAIHQLCGQAGVTVTGVLQALATRAAKTLAAEPLSSDLTGLFPEAPAVGAAIAAEARAVDMARKRRS